MVNKDITRQGFSLLELSASIGTIAILCAVVIPIVANMRPRAEEMTCIANERNLALALNQYVQDNSDRVPVTHNENGRTWVSALKPYISNRSALFCPSDMVGNHSAHTISSYGANAYLDYGQPMERILSPKDTIYLAELSSSNQTSRFHPERWISEKGNGSAWSHGSPSDIAWNRHSGGANYVYIDGHTRWSLFTDTFQYPELNKYSVGHSPLPK